MSDPSALLLIAAVAGVGVLHTIVPDHWVPITLIARQRGWSQRETALAALQAGAGHVTSTLLIGLLVWLAGAAVALRFGHLVETASSIALIAFGGWIALSSWRALRAEGAHGHDHAGAHAHAAVHDHGTAAKDDPLYAPSRENAAILTRHAHLHRHGKGTPHLHWHDHHEGSAHDAAAVLAGTPPLHVHRRRMTARNALLLILGSSPMVEGIPAFFAAGRYGAGPIAAMALIFAATTIATYLLLCVYSTAGLQRVRLGPFERYGEVLSGAFIVLVGIVFWIWPAL